jgi:anion-transporting  ArsA/GET3 family ATPase
MSRKGKKLETEARKFLREYFKTDLIFKLINTERMDFIVIDYAGTIHIVEAKQTKSNYYNPKSSPKKRSQLEHYFEILNELRSIPELRFSSFWMLVRLRGKTSIKRYESMQDIPTRLDR